ncbi:MAG: glutamyl-tRNA reductase [Thermoanaerobacterales bacterium]|nr:glutamyl-tRNA reductase [Thermoanaerobacterales bacterium]
MAAVGLNHRTAPVAVRERLAFPEHRLREVLRTLIAYDGVDSCVIISTCNRTEIYAAVTEETRVDGVWRFLAGCCGQSVEEMRRYAYEKFMGEAIEHLFRVAAGLDSMVLGETQILGQVKTAYQIAQEAGTVNGLLNLVFQQALAVGKRVRAETGIDRNPVSISYAAVELARQVLGSLDGRTVLIVGAGEMSELTVKHLLANGVSGVIVSNRSYDRAQLLAAQFGGRAVHFDELYQWMETADIVISATAAAHYVIKPEPMAAVMRRRDARPIFMIDIAVPRDIDPEVGHLPGVSLYDIDSLQSVVDANLAERRRAAAAAEAIIDHELTEFIRSLEVRYVVPTVTALKRRGEDIKQRELHKALNRLGDLTDHEVKVISTLANSIVNQLLHEPITRLKAYALTNEGAAYADALQKLFDLEPEGDEVNAAIWEPFKHKGRARR